MAKKLEFTFDGKEYVLEFTRRTVKEMERKGFVASDIESKPMTLLPELFAGSFLAHHRGTRADVIDSIFDRLSNKQELIGKLAEMYNEPILALVSDEETDEEGKVDWTVNW